ncbi:16008_t:CDS:2, partial [Racocetra persica]
KRKTEPKESEITPRLLSHIFDDSLREDWILRKNSRDRLKYGAGEFGRFTAVDRIDQGE